MTEMTMPAPVSAGPVEWGRRAAVAAPVVAVFAVGAGAPLYADDLSEAGGTARFAVTAVSTLTVLLLLAGALVALYARQAHAAGRLGRAGFAVALAGTILAAGGAWDSAFTVPYLADQAPAVLDRATSGSLLAGYLISYLTFAIGWALLASATIRARVLPRAGAIVTLVGAVLAVLPAPTALRILPLSIGVALLVRRNA